MDTRRIEFDLTLDDHLAYQMHFAERSPTVRRLRALWLVVYLVWFGVAACVFLVVDVPMLAAGLAVLGLGYVPFYNRDWRRTARRRIKRMLAERGDPGTGKVTVEIGDDGIRSELRGATAQYPWSRVLRIERGDGATYIFVSSVQAIMIPDRGFGSEAEREEFVGAIESAGGRSGGC
ncbi:MAG: YcxB family protein [Armatimonadetes bacterium]|nr:YcxB family protein [Armatimonadota bacterium]